MRCGPSKNHPPPKKALGGPAELAGLRSNKMISSVVATWYDPTQHTGINMVKRRIYDSEGHIHFVTFSCFKRRTFLQQDQAKGIVIGQLQLQLTERAGVCSGFVIMPDHVHALVWFPKPSQLSSFMNKWKDQSSHEIKKLYRNRFPNYWGQLDDDEPIWQARYYGFNIWTMKKFEEKLDYMHANPVRAGLVERAIDWKWSSARWYLHGKQVGLPIRVPPGLETDDEFVVSS